MAGLSPLVALQLNKTVYGCASPLTLGLLVAATSGLAAFVWRSLRRDNPSLDFGLFRNHVFRTANGALFC